MLFSWNFVSRDQGCHKLRNFKPRDSGYFLLFRLFFGIFATRPGFGISRFLGFFIKKRFWSARRLEYSVFKVSSISCSRFDWGRFSWTSTFIFDQPWYFQPLLEELRGKFSNSLEIFEMNFCEWRGRSRDAADFGPIALWADYGIRTKAHVDTSKLNLHHETILNPLAPKFSKLTWCLHAQKWEVFTLRY